MSTQDTNEQNSDGDEQNDDQHVDESKPQLDEEYWMLRTHVRMVINGRADGLLIEAGPGIGKTHQITTLLDDEARSYVTVGGKFSPLAFYNKLYEVADGGILFVDDCDAILESDDCVALLRQATESVTDTRTVSWGTTSSKVDVEEFTFNGRIIICTNDTPDGILFESLRTRLLTYDLEFNYAERMKIMREIVKVPYEDLSFGQRLEIYNWIDSKTGPGDSVNLRTYFHICDYRLEDEERWEALAINQLDNDEARQIRELLEEHETVEDACTAFQEQTDLSRSTFFRRKRKIDADRAE